MHLTPGEILDEEVLKPLGLTPYRLAKDLGVPPRWINDFVMGQRAITVDTALRLGRHLGMAREVLLNLQCHYDLARHLAVVLGCRAPSPRAKKPLRELAGPKRDLSAHIEAMAAEGFTMERLKLEAWPCRF